MSEGYVIPAGKALTRQYTCKTLARSVQAGTLTEAQAQDNNPGFAGYAERRRKAGLGITAQGWELAEAKKQAQAKSTPARRKRTSKTTRTRKASPNGESNGAGKPVTTSELKRLGKDDLIALVLASK